MGRLEGFSDRMQPRPGSGRSTEGWQILANCRLQNFFSLSLPCTLRDLRLVTVFFIPSSVCVFSSR
jgi:hypothetical protein